MPNPALTPPLQHISNGKSALYKDVVCFNVFLSRPIATKLTALSVESGESARSILRGFVAQALFETGVITFDEFTEMSTVRTARMDVSVKNNRVAALPADAPGAGRPGRACSGPRGKAAHDGWTEPARWTSAGCAATTWRPPRRRSDSPTCASTHLRHTYASLMLAAGFRVQEVSHWMGHASIAATDTIYGLLYPTD